ncbi:hypothetical protein CC80DRAFT_596615 [Byssothecium circinans]|uniref:Uncharacterized protein n=1 Tax=Byssothecium circinans TaxID=147558 RepID=A0A6A5TK29_9PLEO|nr:hypothetical protein CC80DRAFT_596615 [Byssothecium circinans]
MAATLQHPDRDRDADTVNHLQSQRSTPDPPQYSEAKESLDITQKLERRLARLNTSNSVLKRWMYEIISWSISALCMGAIVGILVYLNNKSLDKWRSGLTIVAVLSKVASAALILPTSEAIGQLKWNWFNGKKSKEIWDFELFDKASRGAWGSVMLLFRTRGRSLAALGALLTLLLLATDTFFQQVVHLPERWSLEGNSTITRVTWYDSNLDNTATMSEGYEMTLRDTNIWPVASKYFYGNGTEPVPFGNGTTPEVPVSCPTSNCSWPVYETLGTCSKCADLDIKKYLTFACMTTKLDWVANFTNLLSASGHPNGTACGYFLNATSSSPTLMSGYLVKDANSTRGTASAGEALLMRTFPLISHTYRKPYYGGSINFRDIRSPLVDALIVASTGAAAVYQNKTPVAQECVLYWCVKQVKASYYWATYQEKVIASSTANFRPDYFAWKSEPYTGPTVNGTLQYFSPNITIRPDDLTPDEKTFGLTNSTHVNIYAMFDDIFPSFLSTQNETTKPTFKIKSGSTSTTKFGKVKFSP